MNAEPIQPPPKPRTGTIVTLIIGAILTVCGPALGVLIGSFSLIPTPFGNAEHSQLSPSTFIELRAGESIFLLIPVAELKSADHQECTAEASDASGVAVSYQPSSALNTHVNGTRYESFAGITADKAGTYTVSCGTQTSVITAPPLSFSVPSDGGHQEGSSYLSAGLTW